MPQHTIAYLLLMLWMVLLTAGREVKNTWIKITIYVIGFACLDLFTRMIKYGG